MTDFILDRIIPWLLIALGLAMLTAVLIAITAGGGGSITLKPCPTEDSTNCYWDASESGNGTGTDFIDLNGTTYYPED